MRRRIGDAIVELTLGESASQQVDALVATPAAFRALSGIDLPDPPATGEAVLKAAPPGGATGWWIVANPPLWKGGRAGETDLLHQCQSTILNLARNQGCRSIAQPGWPQEQGLFPPDQAADATLSSILAWLKSAHALELVRVVLSSSGLYGAYARVLTELTPE